MVLRDASASKNDALMSFVQLDYKGETAGIGMFMFLCDWNG